MSCYSISFITQYIGISIALLQVGKKFGKSGFIFTTDLLLRGDFFAKEGC